MAALKKATEQDVEEAARERIAWVFDTFPKIYVSFSAGKDSTCMLHLAAQEARKRGRRIAVMLIDLEAQYASTIEHGLEMFEEYKDVIDPYWVSLPIVLRNAVSMFQPRWICWDPTQRESFPFYRHAMEFEEFVEEFGHWYGGGELTACLAELFVDREYSKAWEIDEAKLEASDEE